jgi:hypothetical protein
LSFFATVNKLRIFTSGKGVGVAENPRSGVGARGSSVKKGFSWGKRTLFFGTHVLPLLNFLTVEHIPRTPSRKRPNEVPALTGFWNSLMSQSSYSGLKSKHQILKPVQVLQIFTGKP